MSKVVSFYKTLMINILPKNCNICKLVKDKSVKNRNQAMSIRIIEIVICQH
jgi:hypothetical protein